jgi:hypothetical protein
MISIALSVEFFHVEQGKTELSDFMTARGYVNVKTITHPNNLANDFIFVHSSQKELLEIALKSSSEINSLYNKILTDVK